MNRPLKLDYQILKKNTPNNLGLSEHHWNTNNTKFRTTLLHFRTYHKFPAYLPLLYLQGVFLFHYFQNTRQHRQLYYYHYMCMYSDLFHLLRHIHIQTQWVNDNRLRFCSSKHNHWQNSLGSQLYMTSRNNSMESILSFRYMHYTT